jgi:hypothetical protein
MLMVIMGELEQFFFFFCGLFCKAFSIEMVTSDGRMTNDELEIIWKEVAVT